MVLLVQMMNYCSSVHFTLNDKLRVRLLCFPVGGTITQVFHFSYLSCHRLCLSGTFQSPPSKRCDSVPLLLLFVPPRSLLFISARATVITRMMGSFPSVHMGSPETHRDLYFVCCKVCRLHHCTWQMAGAVVVGTSVAAGMVSQAPPLLLPSYLWLWVPVQSVS